MTIRDFNNLTLEHQFEQFHELGIRQVALHHQSPGIELIARNDPEWRVTLWGDNNIAGTGSTPAEAFADAYLGVSPCTASNSPAGR